MALMKCPECEQTVSDKAKVCPHCWYTLPEHIENYYMAEHYDS